MIDIKVSAPSVNVIPGSTVAKLPKKQIEQAVEEFIRRQIAIPMDATTKFYWNLDQDRPYSGQAGVPPSVTVTFTHQLTENQNV